MPFKSEAQRRFLFAKHPTVAKRWSHEYGTPKNLPKKKHKKKASDITLLKRAMAGALPAAAFTPSPNAAAGINMPPAQPLVPPGPAPQQPQAATTTQPAPAAAPPPPPPPPPGSFKPSSLLFAAADPNSLATQQIAMVHSMTTPQLPLPPDNSESVASGQQLQNDAALHKAAKLFRPARKEVAGSKVGSKLLSNWSKLASGGTVPKLFVTASVNKKPLPVLVKRAFGPGAGMQRQGLPGGPMWNMQQRMMQQAYYQNARTPGLFGQPGGRPGMPGMGMPMPGMMPGMGGGEMGGMGMQLGGFPGNGGAGMMLGANFGGPRQPARQPGAGMGMNRPGQMNDDPAARARSALSMQPDPFAQQAAAPAGPTPEQQQQYHDAFRQAHESQNALNDFTQNHIRQQNQEYSGVDDRQTMADLQRSNPEFAQQIQQTVGSGGLSGLARNVMSSLGSGNMIGNDSTLAQLSQSNPQVAALIQQRRRGVGFQDPSLAGLRGNTAYQQLQQRAQSGNDPAAQQQLEQLENNYRQANPYRMSAQQLQEHPEFQLQLAGAHGPEAQQQANRMLGMASNQQAWQGFMTQYQQRYPTQANQVTAPPAPPGAPPQQQAGAPPPEQQQGGGAPPQQQAASPTQPTTSTPSAQPPPPPSAAVPTPPQAPTATATAPPPPPQQPPVQA